MDLRSALTNPAQAMLFETSSGLPGLSAVIPMLLGGWTLFRTTIATCMRPPLAVCSDLAGKEARRNHRSVPAKMRLVGGAKGRHRDKIRFLAGKGRLVGGRLHLPLQGDTARPPIALTNWLVWQAAMLLALWAAIHPFVPHPPLPFVNDMLLSFPPVHGVIFVFVLVHFANRFFVPTRGKAAGTQWM